MSLKKEVLIPPLCKCGCGEYCKPIRHYHYTYGYYPYLRGHSNRKYSFDRKLFYDILTEEDAYWLGFFFADGFIKDRGSFGFHLSIKDLNHLKKFVKYAKSNYPIDKDDRFCRLEISAKSFLPFLYKKFGLRQGKSKMNLSIPKLLPHLKSHFIRGIFDGDGWVGVYKKNKQPFCGVVGNRVLLNNILTVLHKDYSINRVKLRKDKRHQNELTRQFSYGGNGVCKKFFDALYGNSNIYLERKMRIWNTIFLN